MSSSPLMPARVVQAFKADVQDSGRVFDFFKKQVVGDGAVVQNVAETVAAVSEVAQSRASPDDLLSALGGLAGRNKSRGKHHDESSGGSATSCVSNSFDPNTLVVMGDGSRKPIKDVKVGDKVLAKDPTTGRTAVRVVTDARSHASQRTLVEVGVASEAGRGSVVATDEHPFWVESEKRWSHAVDLKAGHRLETGDHRDATVTGTRSWSEVRRVYNLTVDTDHTYFVVAGQTPVLTHNCDLTDYADSLRPKFHKDTGPFFAAKYTSPSGQTYLGHSGHDLTPIPGGEVDSLVREFAPEDGRYHPGCAETMCLIKAEEAEGAAGTRGGVFEVVKVRGLNSPPGGARGTPASPCPLVCQPRLDRQGISYRGK